MSILGYIASGVSVAISVYVIITSRRTTRAAREAAKRAEAALTASRSERKAVDDA